MSQCAIFDCDGVLVNSEHLCNIGLEMQLKGYGVNESHQDMVNRYRGWKLAAILEDITFRHGLKLSDDFESEYRKKVEKLFETELRPVTGIKEVLSKIDMPMCVASSGPSQKILQALRVTGLLDYFEGRIYSSYDVQSWKPEPGLFLHAAANMGFAPDECIVIEDSAVGVQAANAANMQVLWYRGVTSSEKRSRIFNDMAELPELLHITQRSSWPALAPAAT